ncbi:hypothetical protein [Streptococcus gallolyticus]|nr:hypothetical protein [Streptococcus gallolyticus]QBX16167.1 hypothetical protein Javan235_0028 [Streptococcus phage Javan235]
MADTERCEGCGCDFREGTIDYDCVFANGYCCNCLANEEDDN